MINLALNNSDKFENTYNVMQANYIKYDMHTLFHIICLDKSGVPKAKQVSLYKNHAMVIMDKVAASITRLYPPTYGEIIKNLFGKPCL